MRLAQKMPTKSQQSVIIGTTNRRNWAQYLCVESDKPQ